MCGILGISFVGRREDAVAAVERGLRTITHRGPDDQGIAALCCDKSAIRNPQSAMVPQVVFGHQRLSIIDLSSAGHQPMLDPEIGNWITYNGEVYNYRELRRELEGLGCRFRSNSDTEVLLQSYRIWGQDCVKRWRGMFALAIWDEQRKEIFLARDRLGIKPLYYSEISNCELRIANFVFGSELRAILASGLVEPKLNVTGLDTFLMFGAVQDPLTIIEGVKSLPAAHTLTLKANGSIELKEYWDVRDDLLTSAVGLPPLPLGEGRGEGVPPPPLGEGRGEGAVRDTLAEAVRLRLISDVPLGVFLSGGIDSSAVAMLAQAGSADQVKTFTIGFEEASFDEGELAGATASQLGVQHHPILLTEAEMLASCEAAIAALDQPSIDGVNRSSRTSQYSFSSMEHVSR